MDPRFVDRLTPTAIVDELDRYIVGQRAAKRAVAIALRNRWRRQRVEGDLRDEIAPKNIIMMGPTGVGKTEIARRLAKLAGAPFLKVEASKFTEVGYVGRDVESVIRDLMEVSIKLVKDEEATRVRPKAREAAEERLLDLLLPAGGQARSYSQPAPLPGEADPSPAPGNDGTREKLRDLLHKGKLDDREVEVETSDAQVEEMAPHVRAYLDEAKSYADQGITAPKVVRDIAWPAELIEALDADPELAEAFHALTPGRQKSYAFNLNQAKKPDTRFARIERFRPRILAGKGALERWPS